jgi:hypothetical protein
MFFLRFYVLPFARCPFIENRNFVKVSVRLLPRSAAFFKDSIAWPAMFSCPQSLYFFQGDGDLGPLGLTGNGPMGLKILYQRRQFTALVLHDFGFCFRMNMVVSEKVQYAMHEQFIETFSGGHAGLSALSDAGVDRNHHIAQYFGMDVTMFAFPHRERNHIGGPLMIQVHLVEPGDMIIVHEQNG